MLKLNIVVKCEMKNLSPFNL